MPRSWREHQVLFCSCLKIMVERVVECLLGRKELKEEARGAYPKTVQKLAEEEPDIGLVPPTNEEMRPHVRRVDKALAAHIKRARKLYCSGGANKMIDDAQFYEMFRLANQ